MKILLYVVAVIMILGWIIGFIGYALGGLIHLLLVIAAISIVFNMVGNKTSSA